MTRYQLLTIENRGRRVAHIRDTRTGQDFRIHSPNGRLLHWDRMDEPVKEAGLRRVAREALGG